jgi:LssY C-terminus
VVLIGDAPVALAALSRSGWSFTHRIDLESVRRELGAAISGAAYPVAPVSSLYALGRKQDFAVQRARGTITRRNHMRLWLAPFRFEGRHVWFGQVSRDIGVKLTPKSPTLTTHVIDPAVDEARAYLLQTLFTHGVVERYAFVKGAAAATRSAPRYNLTEDPYYSDGMRLVVAIAQHSVPPEQITVYDWEEPEGPIAEGQGDDAGKPVPLDPVAPAPAPASGEGDGDDAGPGPRRVESPR